MSYELRILLAGAPSMNTADHQTRWVRYREKRYFREQVWAATRGKLPPAALKKAKVRITRRTAASREPDFDNLAQGGKFVLDALVDFGVLAGDGPDVIGPPDKDRYRWERVPRGQKSVLIEVWDDST